MIRMDFTAMNPSCHHGSARMTKEHAYIIGMRCPGPNNSLAAGSTNINQHHEDGVHHGYLGSKPISWQRDLGCKQLSIIHQYGFYTQQICEKVKSRPIPFTMLPLGGRTFMQIALTRYIYHGYKLVFSPSKFY